MALVRCPACALKDRRYVRHVLPAGYPTSGVICDRPSCRLPGLIWLEAKEAIAYNRGQRIFSLGPKTMKVQAQ